MAGLKLLSWPELSRTGELVTRDGGGPCGGWGPIFCCWCTYIQGMLWALGWELFIKTGCLSPWRINKLSWVMIMLNIFTKLNWFICTFEWQTSRGIASTTSLSKTKKKPQRSGELNPEPLLILLKVPDDLCFQHLELSFDTNLPLQALCWKAVTGMVTQFFWKYNFR